MYQIVTVDESGCGTLASVRRTDWTPRGMRAVMTVGFNPEERHQILPACTQSGVIYTRMHQESTDGELFVDFIDSIQLLDAIEV
jgi:hypothetical protein